MGVLWSLDTMQGVVRLNDINFISPMFGLVPLLSSRHCVFVDIDTGEERGRMELGHPTDMEVEVDRKDEMADGEEEGNFGMWELRRTERKVVVVPDITKTSPNIAHVFSIV